ncbi:MAG TPA: BatA and WFA domain-containing protein [Candidatus Limnocylindrales bacterium]|nr:BatA and WFA domain-containing protein [Candidatus Limnocylindrales bacterium]
MSFLTPLALVGLLFVPAVIAMYLLKLRRDEAVVPSTLLWQRLVADVEANAPWQRLRRSLLLLLQILLVLILAALAARPFLERPAGLAQDLVLVVDTSASMAATDVAPDRLTAAKQLALDALRELPAGGKVSVVAAGRTARVVVNATTDLGRVRAAIEGLTITPASGDLGDALNLADALASRSGDAEILVATDAALAKAPTSRLDHDVTVLQVGRDRKNQAIVALAVRQGSSGISRSVFVSVANLDIETAQRRLQLYGDGVLLEARDMLLDPQTRTEAIIDDIPADVRVVEVRLDRGEDGTAGGTDLLALDDRAWAVVPPDRLRRILLVSEGDPYLETALTYLPNTELYGVSPDDYGPETNPELFDLIIFEGEVPEELPPTAVLAIGPTETSVLGEVVGRLRDPGIATLDPDEPVLRYVDLSTTHIGSATKLVLPAWARSVIPGPGGSPLLYVGELEGRKAAVLAFEPRNSDLPLQVAFPILLSNLAGELMGGSAAPTEAVAPGDPVSLPLPAGATALEITRPDGTTMELAPGTPGAGSVSFSQTDLLGVYTAVAVYPEATPTAAPTATPTAAPSGSAAASPSVAPSASAGGSPTPVPTAPPADPNAPARFAVDLFDPGESNIAPGSAASIEALGGAAASSPGPSGSGAPGSPAPTATATPTASGAGGGAGTTDDRPPARDELWVPIVLIALLVLLAEWLVYQRDAVMRLWRGFRARTGRGAVAPTGGTGAGTGRSA